MTSLTCASFSNSSALEMGGKGAPRRCLLWRGMLVDFLGLTTFFLVFDLPRDESRELASIGVGDFEVFLEWLPDVLPCARMLIDWIVFSSSYR